MRTRELPVIMLSARAGEEAAIEGLGSGADDYLPKPFSGRELVARVRAHLEMAQVRRQAADELRAKSDRLEEALAQLLRSQQLIAAQRDILALIAGGAPLERALHEIVRWIELIAEPGARGVGAAARRGRPAPRATARRRACPPPTTRRSTASRSAPASGSCGTAAYRRETVIVERHRHRPAVGRLPRARRRSTGCGACWSVPILGHRRPARRARSRSTTTTRAAPTDEDLRRGRAAGPHRGGGDRAQPRRCRRAPASSPSCRAACCPRALPEIPGLGVAASFRPGDRSLEVGGDFYDVFEIGAGAGASSSATCAATAPRRRR